MDKGTVLAAYSVIEHIDKFFPYSDNKVITLIYRSTEKWRKDFLVYVTRKHTPWMLPQEIELYHVSISEDNNSSIVRKIKNEHIENYECIYKREGYEQD